ncbi:MAG TPA: hypothetical protein VFW33_10880 [Gemmataceae bacterium]|nr:hypothetical protein [Gemmataceae bacterium]
MRPWLLRLLACRVRAREFDKPGRDTAALQDWMTGTYPAGWPPELRGVVLGSQVTVPLARRVLNVSWEVVKVLLGLALVFGFCGGLLYVIDSTTKNMAVEMDTPEKRAPLIFFGILGVVGALVLFTLHWGKPFLYAWCSLLCRVGPAPPPTGGEAPAPDDSLRLDWAHALPAGGVLALLPDKLLRKLLPPPRSQVIPNPRRGPVTSYRELSALLPADERQRLRETNAAMKTFFLTVRLAVDDAAVAGPGEAAVDIAGRQRRLLAGRENVGVPWEAVLGLAALPEERAAPASPPRPLSALRLDFQRVRPEREVTVREPFDGPPRVAAWAAGLSLANLVRRAWSGVIDQPPFCRLEVTHPREPVAEAARVGVLHVLGAPVQDHPEVYLNVRETGAVAGGLVKPEEVLQRFPSLRLCVLQGLPAAPGKRTDADRDAAAVLRRFGAKVFEYGVPAVVLLPPVSEELTAEAIKILTTAVLPSDGALRWAGRQGVGSLFQPVAAHGNSVPRLTRAVGRVRELFAERGAADPEAALEVAFDVALYTTSTLNLMTAPPPSGGPP